MKRLRQVTWLLIVALLITLFTACHYHPGNRAGKQSSEINWEDSAYNRFAEAEQLYNNNMHDSLMAVAPGVLDFLREHQQWDLYYPLWRYVVEDHVWYNEFAEAAQEAEAMQKDAIARNNSFGLALSYLTQATSFMVQDNNDEAKACYKKAISTYPMDQKKGPLMGAYGYYTTLLYNGEDMAELDSVLTSWHKLLERITAVNIEDNAKIYAHWKHQYYDHLAHYLVKTGQLTQAATAIDSLVFFAQQSGLTHNHSCHIAMNRFNLAMAQGNYIDALKYANEMQSLATGDIGFKQQALKNKTNALEKLGRYIEAYTILQEYVQLHDSVTLADNRKQLNQLSQRYQVNELKANNDLLQQRSRFTTGGVVMIFGIVALLVFLVYSSRWSRRLEIKNQQLQRERNVVVAAHNKLQTAYQQLEETTTAKERIESELRIARDIQMSMVPNVFPQHDRLDLFGAMTPAREVGGDLYDYLLDGDRLYFCVGDVSGKGVPASLFMAQTIRLFRIMAKQHQMPAYIVTRLNDELAEKNENGMFVTMFIGLLDLQTGHLDFCNAGHNPPVLGGGSHHGEFLSMVSNAPIGLWTGLEFVGEQLESIINRPLFIYTDGLNEAENGSQQQFGDAHLLDILQHCHFDSARQVVEHLEAEVARHRNGAEPNDDLTMLCLNLTSA